MPLNEDFDGQVIGIVQGEIGPNSIETYFLEGQRLRRFDLGIDEKLPEKVKVSMLIDSGGGSALSALGFRDCLNKIKERGGTVNTYGFNQFASGAARLWLVGNERFCADSSIGLWHEPQFDLDVESLVTETIQKKYELMRAAAQQEIRDFVLGMNSEVVNEALLNNAGNDPEGRFTVKLPGALLHRWGGATKAFPDHAATFRHFFQETGWEPSRWKLMMDPVGQFVRSTLTWKGSVALL